MPLYLLVPLFRGADALLQMPDITPDEMAKAKVGFAVRFINRELTADALLPDALNDHNQAALEFFLTVQEAADERLGSCKYNVYGSSLCRWLTCA